VSAIVLASIAVPIGVPAARASATTPSGSSTAHGGGTSSGSRPTASPAGIPVEAYVTAGRGAPGLVARSAGAATTIGIDGVTVLDDGSGLSTLDPAVARAVRAAHAAGATAELLVSNYSDSVEDFSPAVGTALLGDPAHRSAVVAALVDDAASADADGVQVDLESLRTRDRAGLTAFVTELRTALRTRIGDAATVSIAVMAATSRVGYSARGYDVPAIAVAADRLVLMTYDQHGPSWSDAGPVGGLPWQRRAVRAFLASGAPAGRVDLGVAGYGYTWPAHGTGALLTDDAARRKAGPHAVWSAEQGEWHATLPSGLRMWWSDARSFDARTALTRQLGVHGVALWQLRGSDPLR
jgi:spore germination protein YaaH